ncbi:MAG: 5'/3'-nucleotidase SurE [Acidobacteria bacterium]|nr:5'/3'-nucleotidase SurE [Acidobacteriota bacterium]
MSRQNFSCALLLIGALSLSTASAQSPRPYRILVTNDDGVRAPGLMALAEALRPLGEITIVAPDDNQSAKGHSLTQADPIYVESVTLSNGLTATAVSATPVTCVKLALAVLMPQPPDLLVSGINPGYNLGMVAYVSGTVGAAREGALQGIPAISISVDRVATGFNGAAQVAAEIAAVVKVQGLPRGTFLNVGVPAGDRQNFKGIRLTRQSGLSGVERYEEGKTPGGRRYFWDVYSDPGSDVEGVDISATRQGFVAVTPLHAGEFDQKAFDELQGVIR